MTRTKLQVKDGHHTCIDALGPLGVQSCKLSGSPFPGVHWTVHLQHDELELIRRAADVLHSFGYRAVTARQTSDIIFLIFARCGAAGLESIGVSVPLCQITDALLCCPRGLLLAIFGPDGVGKSSMSTAAVAALAPFFDHQRTVCWRPQLISSRVAKEPHKFKLPHDASTHGSVVSMMKITGACLDFLLDHATLTRNQLRGSALIAWDRYVYDVAVDKKRYRYSGPSWYSDLLLRSLPIPDRFLGIVLDADEQVILSRKRDLPLHELQRQRLAYRRLTSCLPETHVVRNDGDFKSCLQRVLSLAIDRMACWFEPVARESLSIRSVVTRP